MSRKATGLVRAYPVPVNFDGDEDEYVAREAYDQGISKAEFVRRLVLTDGWRKRILILRKKQARMPLHDFRRAPLERETPLHV